MPTIDPLLSLLKNFAESQKKGCIPYNEFAEYIKSYLQHGDAASPETGAHENISDEQLQDALLRLSDDNVITISVSPSGSKFIVVIPFYIERITQRYRKMERDPDIPFPVADSLSKQLPADFVIQQPIADFIKNALDDIFVSDKILYGLSFSKALPKIVVPGSLPISMLLGGALGKIRIMLSKEEHHDYFLKKLKISNPGREMTISNFFAKILQPPVNALSFFKDSSDSFFFWSQLCFFIRQDYAKIQDFTQEDISVLHAVSIIEIAVSHFRTRAQQDLQRETAFKNLEQLLCSPPHYFDYIAITGFVDSRGIPLLGQYSEKDLKEYLYTATTTVTEGELPSLLSFTVEKSHRYYISKKKVVPLILRLCSDAHDTIRKDLTEEWFGTLKKFDSLPEMHDQKLFENRLEAALSVTSPVLYALLGASFLPVVNNETQQAQPSGVARLNLFHDGTLLPYSDLLMLSRHELLTDAKILLPVWYTIPFVPFIMSLFLKKPKFVRKQKKEVPVRGREASAPFEPEDSTLIPSSGGSSRTAKKLALKKAAKNVEAILVPENSTLDRELSAYLQQWNRLVNKDIRANLTEDVNCFIRDYLRRVLRSLPAASFTRERVHELAESLVKTPGMQRIRDQEQLCMYIELYIVHLIKML